MDPEGVGEKGVVRVFRLEDGAAAGRGAEGWWPGRGRAAAETGW
jgi:hypothetical protein